MVKSVVISLAVTNMIPLMEEEELASPLFSQDIIDWSWR